MATMRTLCWFLAIAIFLFLPWQRRKAGMSAVEQGEGSSAGLVQRCWEDLAVRRGCQRPMVAAGLDALLCAYRQPHRHYHTLDHIAALLVLLDRHAEAGSDREALALAILFHDVVYDPRRQDNEPASAAIAAGCLNSLGFPEDLVAKVVCCIRATQHAKAGPATADPDIALLLDLDLSILAAPREAYRTYARAVRREYAHVPDAAYRPGRRRVLEGFLEREPLYLTERLRAAWEEPARANLAAEIAELS
jgi:predicted metal-dependent HD superfamily phosphohydrolase